MHIARRHHHCPGIADLRIYYNYFPADGSEVPLRKGHLFLICTKCQIAPVAVRLACTQKGLKQARGCLISIMYRGGWGGPGDRWARSKLRSGQG